MMHRCTHCEVPEQARHGRNPPGSPGWAAPCLESTERMREERWKKDRKTRAEGTERSRRGHMDGEHPEGPSWSSSCTSTGFLHLHLKQNHCSFPPQRSQISLQHTHTHCFQDPVLNRSLFINTLCSFTCRDFSTLTGNPVRLHFEVADVIPGAYVFLSTNSADAGPHGCETSASVDLVWDGLQVTQSRPVFNFGLGQFSLALVHFSLQLLWGRSMKTLVRNNTCAHINSNIHPDCYSITSLQDFVITKMNIKSSPLWFTCVKLEYNEEFKWRILSSQVVFLKQKAPKTPELHHKS